MDVVLVLVGHMASGSTLKLKRRKKMQDGKGGRCPRIYTKVDAPDHYERGRHLEKRYSLSSDGKLS
jgi:hypothetical protein